MIERICIVNELIKVREPEDLAHPLNRIFPIQSIGQFLSVLITLTLVWFLFWIFGKVALHKSPPLDIILGLVAGSMPLLYSLLPSRFVVETKGSIERKSIVSLIEDKAYRYGYRNRHVKDNTIAFSPRWPKFLVWQENTLRIEEIDNGIRITGPSVIVKHLYAVLLKTLTA